MKKKCTKHLAYHGESPPETNCRDCRKLYALEHRADDINDVAQALGITHRATQNYYAEEGVSSPSGSPGKSYSSIERGMQDKKERHTKKVERVRVEEALTRISELEGQIGAFKQLQGAESSYVIHPREKSDKSEAVAVAVATDWHLGCEVRPESVNGLNTFNVAICKKRVETFFQRVVRFTDKERQDVKINELVLFLGGDLIDGSLHLDSIQSQDVSGPISQAILCQELIEAGLNFLLNHGKFSRITVVCCDGNHSRLTARQHWASRKGNALEYLMYYNIASRFPQLNWIIATGIHAYLDVFGSTMRFHHGDTIHFGGVNGPYTYLNRRIMQWDQSRQAHYSIQGHLHTYTLGTRKWVINGSLIGYTAYGQSLGGEFQPPIQSFFLWDKQRGPTVHIPIIL